MKHWIIDPRTSRTGIDSDDACRLISAVGSADRRALAKTVLTLVNRHTATASCTIMAYEVERNPRLLSAASLDNEWDMFHHASEYLRELFRYDTTYADLRRILPSLNTGAIVVNRQLPLEISDPGFSQLCGETLGIIDGAAITIKTGRRQWLTVSLCRHHKEGMLAEDDIMALRKLAPLIATCAARHCELEADGESGFRSSVSDGIDEISPKLTNREREVVLRILDGATTERIAEDLGIRPTTVITYRTRAYDKLGVSSRRELFSAILRSRNGMDSARPSKAFASDWHGAQLVCASGATSAA